MKDKLKQHIERNREDFEVYDADFDLIWNNIESDLKSSKSGKTRSIFSLTIKVAAAVLLLISLALAFKVGQQSVLMNKNGIALHDVSTDMAETEAYYSNLIDQQMQIINANKNDIADETWQSLEKLDLDYQSLKKDMKDHADSKEVIEAMIQYYRLKLEMLEQISSELQDKQYEDDDISI